MGLDARFDLMMNRTNGQIAFEVADAVIFTEYLIYGESALDPNPLRRAWQIDAGDIDGDGVPLTQADYDEMVRIIEGGPQASG